MSDRNIENLVDQSLHTIDTAMDEWPSVMLDLSPRTLVSALWRFCDQFDTQFTRFRNNNMSISLRARAIYKFELSEHPRIKEFEPAIEEFTARPESHDWTGAPRIFGWLRRSGRETVDRQGPIAGYVEGSKGKLNLYCEAGSWLWSEMVEERRICNEDDCTTPTILSDYELGLAICRLGKLTHDNQIISDWYKVLAREAWQQPLYALKKNVQLASLRQLVAEIGVHNLPPSDFDDQLNEETDEQTLKWWFANNRLLNSR